jgi:hypothetical protein
MMMKQNTSRYRIQPRGIKCGLVFWLLITLSPIAVAEPDASCDPLVKPILEETTLAKTLVSLSQEYNFALSFPKNLDRPVEKTESRPLSRLLKQLTGDMNTVLRHEEEVTCVGLRLVELIVIPVGDESELIRVEQKSAPEPAVYIYIDNMEQYATEVLLHKRKPDMAHMTPEQKIEFKTVKKRLKLVMKDEIRQLRDQKDKSKETGKKKHKAARKKAAADSQEPATPEAQK